MMNWILIGVLLLVILFVCYKIHQANKIIKEIYRQAEIETAYLQAIEKENPPR